VAHHGENRKKDLFRPNKGMLYGWSEKNLELYKKGSLKPVLINMDDGSQEFYSLTDEFHHKSGKASPEYAFRDVSLCKNLQANLNSSVAEQAIAAHVKRQVRSIFVIYD